jgi:hypothetical protein
VIGFAGGVVLVAFLFMLILRRLGRELEEIIRRYGE